MLLSCTEFLLRYFAFLNTYVNGGLIFRSLMAALTAFLITLLTVKPIINWSKKLRIGQIIRADGPKTHLVKKNTPTMGGIIIIFSVFVAVLLWAKLYSFCIWIVLFVLISFGVVGLLDDFLKTLSSYPHGLSVKYKYFLQSIFALIAMIWIYFLLTNYIKFNLLIPYSESFFLPLGLWGILSGYLVITGSSNAVNLTDGLDGLAIFPIMLVSIGLAIYIYIITTTQNIILFNNTVLNESIAELIIICAAISGASLAFLWFNIYPAEIFMGDVGSLSLGATLGSIAVIIRQELVFCIMSLLFVIETLSVILQVGGYKLRKKRIFKMAPLHHHFELKGWSEIKVVIRFWILSFIFVLIGLLSVGIY